MPQCTCGCSKNVNKHETALLIKTPPVTRQTNNLLQTHVYMVLQEPEEVHTLICTLCAMHQDQHIVLGQQRHLHVNKFLTKPFTTHSSPFCYTSQSSALASSSMIRLKDSLTQSDSIVQRTFICKVSRTFMCKVERSSGRLHVHICRVGERLAH